jgi:hypothetical protein
MRGLADVDSQTDPDCTNLGRGSRKEASSGEEVCYEGVEGRYDFQVFCCEAFGFGEKRWEESEKVGEEDEDDGEGGEADLEAEGEQGAGSVESRE